MFFSGMLENENENQNELWRSANLILMQQLIDNAIEVVLYIPCEEEDCSELEVPGLLTQLNGNTVTFRAYDPNFGTWLPDLAPGEVLHFDYAYELSVVGMAGYPMPMLHSGHGQIYEIERGCGRLEMTIWLSPHFTTRAVRRHERLDWQPYMKATVGLKIVSPMPKKRVFLRPIVHEILRDDEHKPEVMNISAGGACLLVHRDLASHSMAESSSYLMIFSPFAERGKPPYIVQCRKSGIRPDSEVGPYIGLRLQFVREIDWEKSADELVWRNVLANGSEVFGEMVEKFRNNEL